MYALWGTKFDLWSCSSICFINWKFIYIYSHVPILTPPQCFEHQQKLTLSGKSSKAMERSDTTFLMDGGPSITFLNCSIPAASLATIPCLVVTSVLIYRKKSIHVYISVLSTKTLISSLDEFVSKAVHTTISTYCRNAKWKTLQLWNPTTIWSWQRCLHPSTMFWASTKTYFIR
jgi:hypothetical protein